MYILLPNIETNTQLLLDNHKTLFTFYIPTLADKKIICSYVDAPASGSAPSSEGTIEAFCRAGDRMTLALGKIDSSAGTVCL